ncbi:hypothetical protein CEE37_07540 [candidate division LCP-89 bacterium B3_LCP]|uniref:Transposase IS200-like domain-containing protein n=1 Tax=candidate division LCP-89 bacterium B3_LCP TaxID=2012998 RepID=A0A532V0V9_UNCL8|nr:MAG: hypothetical protein CEE37_07540 [candidate division LCP-89 bacterium B3_LCP]
MKNNISPRRPNSLRLPGFDYSCNATYFLTISTKGKQQVFDNSLKRSIINKTAIDNSDLIGLDLIAICVMPDHIHIIIHNPGERPIGDFVRNYKSNVYHYFRKEHNVEKSFWQRYYYDHIIRDDRDFKEKFQYVLENPVKEGLTSQECDPDYVYVNQNFMI